MTVVPTDAVLAATYAEIEQLTGLDEKAWSDFLKCDDAERALIVDGYRSLDWAARVPIVTRVLDLLQVVAAPAGALGAIRGLLP